MSSALRLLYRTFESTIARRATLAGARTIAAVTGTTADGWLSAFERRFVRSGWPGHGTNWTNLQASRFLTHVRRAARSAPMPLARRAPPPRSPLRVGIIGRFGGLLGFPPMLFEACPPDIHLTAFDVAFHGKWAEWLERMPLQYRRVDLDAAGVATQQTARAIADADLDLLVNVNWKADAHHLLDIVNTSCVANYCVGSDLLHHPRVDIELVWQLQPDNEIRSGRMWCTQSQLPVGDTFVYQISGLYDRRGLPFEAPRPWAARDPLIVSHGSLYKFAVEEFVACMLDVLATDPHLAWILVGKDNGQALARIRAMAAARGLGDRVHYEGEFRSDRNAEGVVADPGWQKVQDLLRRARLSPDPFPIGGGSSRFEVYLLGAPCPHIGPSRERRTLASCELPVLVVPPVTASTVQEYFDICIRALTDSTFATLVQQHQLAAARRACDPVRWWRELEQAFAAWQQRQAAAA